MTPREAAIAILAKSKNFDQHLITSRRVGENIAEHLDRNSALYREAYEWAESMPEAITLALEKGGGIGFTLAAPMQDMARLQYDLAGYKKYADPIIQEQQDRIIFLEEQMSGHESPAWRWPGSPQALKTRIDELEAQLEKYTTASHTKTDWCPVCNQGWSAAEEAQRKAASIELYLARTERTAAKAAHRAYREAHGSCEALDEYERKMEPCYHIGGEPDEWCEVCAGSIPTHQRRKAASQRVAVAMRRLMQLCRKATINYPEAKNE